MCNIIGNEVLGSTCTAAAFCTLDPHETQKLRTLQHDSMKSRMDELAATDYTDVIFLTHMFVLLVLPLLYLISFTFGKARATPTPTL